MPTYSDSDYEALADAICRDAPAVQAQAAAFEAAAFWYHLDRGMPGPAHRRGSPTQRKTKLKALAASSRRLLKHLGIEDPSAAANGPSDREMLELLTAPAGMTEDFVLDAMERICRLAEIIEGAAAVALFADLSEEAAGEAERLGELTVLPGHSGDRAVNDWIAAMLGIYQAVTGTEPRTSVGGPGATEQGIAGGPLIRFVQAAAKPLEREQSATGRSGREVWDLTPDALRSRIRTLVEQSE